MPGLEAGSMAERMTSGHVNYFKVCDKSWRQLATMYLIYKYIVFLIISKNESPFVPKPMINLPYRLLSHGRRNVVSCRVCECTKVFQIVTHHYNSCGHKSVVSLFVNGVLVLLSF